MLTKQADALVGAITGGVRAARLSDAERKYLRKRYGLADDANLTARNAIRGAIGGTGGILAGGAIGAMLHPRLSLPGLLGGGLAGSMLTTNRFSKGNAAALRKE